MQRLRNGEDWRLAAKELFHGSGSLGNGAAMCVAPVGAYFGDNLPARSRRSCGLRRSHSRTSQGIAGAIGVAVAAARAWQLRASAHPDTPRELLEPIIPYVPQSQVRRGIETACREAGRSLGRGSIADTRKRFARNGSGYGSFALWSARTCKLRRCRMEHGKRLRGY